MILYYNKYINIKVAMGPIAEAGGRQYYVLPRRWEQAECYSNRYAILEIMNSQLKFRFILNQNERFIKFPIKDQCFVFPKCKNKLINETFHSISVKVHIITICIGK